MNFAKRMRDLEAMVKAEDDVGEELFLEQGTLAIAAAGGASASVLREMLGADTDSCRPKVALRVIAKTDDSRTLAEVAQDALRALARDGNCFEFIVASAVDLSLQKLGVRLLPLVLQAVRDAEAREREAFVTCAWSGTAESENRLCNQALHALGGIATQLRSRLMSAAKDRSPSVRALAARVSRELERAR